MLIRWKFGHRNKMWRSEHFNCCFIRKWGIATETLVSRKLRTGLLIRNSNSEKEIHFRGRDTPHQPSDLSTDAIF